VQILRQERRRSCPLRLAASSRKFGVEGNDRNRPMDRAIDVAGSPCQGYPLTSVTITISLGMPIRSGSQ
jgi:hypothetical protein